MAKKSEVKNRNGGRKSIVIDWEKVDRYLQAQCDGAKIARLMGLHPDTLYNQCKRIYGMDFSAYSTQKKGEGQELLRAKMFQTALNGNVTMQIWLSKQYLGMKEKTEQDVTVQPIEIIYKRMRDYATDQDTGNNT